MRTNFSFKRPPAVVLLVLALLVAALAASTVLLLRHSTENQSTRTITTAHSFYDEVVDPRIWAMRQMCQGAACSDLNNYAISADGNTVSFSFPGVRDLLNCPPDTGVKFDFSHISLSTSSTMERCAGGKPDFGLVYTNVTSVHISDWTLEAIPSPMRELMEGCVLPSDVCGRWSSFGAQLSVNEIWDYMFNEQGAANGMTCSKHPARQKFVLPAGMYYHSYSCGDPTPTTKISTGFKGSTAPTIIDTNSVDVIQASTPAINLRTVLASGCRTVPKGSGCDAERFSQIATEVKGSLVIEAGFGIYGVHRTLGACRNIAPQDVVDIAFQLAKGDQYRANTEGEQRVLPGGKLILQAVCTMSITRSIPLLH